MAEPIDLYSTAIDADPFPMYRRLRDEFPCYWSPSAGIWFLSRYDDVAAAADETELARIVGDYIAGMTDRFALQEHRKLTDPDVRA